MKKLILITLCILSAQLVSAQVLKLGAKVGMGSSSVKADDLLIRNGNDLEDLKLNFQSSSPTIQGGLFARVSLLGLYVQPELLLTFANASYLEEGANVNGTLHNERLVYLDMPVTAGMKLAFLRVYGGPVFSTLISSNSDLAEIDGLNRNFKQSSVAGQIGTGLDLGGKITLDLKYEFRLSGKEDQISFLGNDYNLSKRKSQAIVSLGYVF